MQVWEKSRDNYIEKRRRAFEMEVQDAKQRWKEFSETGKCVGIGCIVCPLDPATCSVSLQDRREKITQEVQE